VFITDKNQAELQLRVIQKRTGKLTYDEALMLYKQACQFIEDCGPFDPTTETFIRQRNTMLILMDALNWVNDLGRHDHQDKYRVIITGKYSGNIDEIDVWILRSHLKETRLLMSDLRAYAQHLYVAEGKTALLPTELIDELTI